MNVTDNANTIIMLHAFVYFLCVRPLPNHAYVEDYIKAYYLSEKDTEEWLKKHQVICTLILCVCQNV